MRYSTLLIGLGLLPLVCVPPTRAVDGDARALVKQTLDAAPKTSLTAKAKLSTRAGERELELNFKWMNDHAATYLEVLSPKDVKGMRFLFLEKTDGADKQFIYLPIMQRTVQVSADTRAQPFLGSDFYLSDMVAGELDAFSYRFVGEEEIGGRKCKLIEVVAKNPADDLYGKKIVAVDPGDLVITRTQFYDKKDKLVKLWTIDQLEKIDGIWTPRKQTMKNLQDASESRIDLLDIKYNVDLPEHMFTRTYIDR